MASEASHPLPQKNMYHSPIPKQLRFARYPIGFVILHQILYTKSCSEALYPVLRFEAWSMKVNATLPKTNIAPENWWFGDYFPCGKAYFQGLC